jgi:hypothetical protein
MVWFPRTITQGADAQSAHSPRGEGEDEEMQNARVSRLLERPPSLRFAAADGDPRKWARKVRAAVQRLALPSSSSSSLDELGTLTLPEGAGEHPAVLLCGADAALAPALATAGIASFALRLDPADEAEAAAADQAYTLAGRSLLAARADDALAALDLLAAHPGVRADQLGVYGAGDAGGAVALLTALLHTEPLPVAVAGHLGSYPAMTLPRCPASCARSTCPTSTPRCCRARC